MPSAPRIIVGITCHTTGASEGRPGRVSLRRAYLDAVVRAGGTPVLLPPTADRVGEHLSLCDAFVFTGGDDPRTEEFGFPTHPRASVMDPERQRHEVSLLRLLRDSRPDAPVLGVCLGMQLMALLEGGELNQCLDDDTPTAGDHAPPREDLLPSRSREGAGGGRSNANILPHEDPPPAPPASGRGDQKHAVRVLVEHPLIKAGEVNSWHRQAVRSAGAMRVVATAHDGVIEAIDDPRRAFCLGVQWHPERISDVGLSQRAALGDALFAALVMTAAKQTDRVR